MTINATLINLYHVCPRECWLHANGINMESTSEIVADGKLLHETSYPQRAERYEEIDVSATYNGVNLTGKIDFYDSKNKIIHEIKRSDRVEAAHQWQVKYYLWLLQLNNINDAKGILEYPTLRQTDEVFLLEDDCRYLEKMINEIPSIIQSTTCPAKLNTKICKNCSYYELCYIDEL